MRYNDHVIYAAQNYKGENLAAVYEFIETEKETDLGEIECRLNLVEIAQKTFKDTGHAVAWGLSK